MDGKGRCTDDIFVERLWRSLKYEEFYLHAYASGRKPRPVLAPDGTFTTPSASTLSVGELPGFLQTIADAAALLQVFWHRRGDARNQIAADFRGYVVDLDSAWAQTQESPSFLQDQMDGGARSVP